MKIDGLDLLKKAATRVRAIPEATERAAYRAVNSVLGKVATQARRDIGAQINLPQSYIREQQKITKAGPNRPVGYIRMRMRAIRMARFDARQITVAAKQPTRAKGDARRGIPAGRKAAGVSVRITRAGGRTSRKAGFLLPLRAGKTDGGNGMGVFVRTGKGKGAIQHKYGPSPDQLFRRWKTESAPDIQRMLLAAYTSQLRYELRGTRK